MTTDKDFIWSEEREPHFYRRKEILREKPEVKKLFGIDKTLKYKVILVSALQLIASIYIPHNFWGFVAVLILVGSTLDHIIVLAIHEITHNLAFKSEAKNNWLAMIVNLPLVVPFAMAFKVYHQDHHWYQGKQNIDTDLPTKWEARLFKGIFGKFIWLVFQMLFYAFRPLLIYPRKPDNWQLINAAIQVAFIIGYYFLFGGLGLLYMLLSISLATGLHPLAGHFVSEHYITVPGQETYSYYGPLNRFVFNVGYHNEHHDFPNIPGSKLPELRKIGGKHYDELHSYNSWTKVIFDFLTKPQVGLASRVRRDK